MPTAQATIAGTATTILTCPSGQNLQVDSITFANVSATNGESLYVYVVPNGSTAGVTNAIIYALSVPLSRTVVWNDPIQLDAGDKIQATGLLTGSVVTATASYRSIQP